MNWGFLQDVMEEEQGNQRLEARVFKAYMSSSPVNISMYCDLDCVMISSFPITRSHPKIASSSSIFAESVAT